jgi:hypothetical protein
MQSRFNRLWVVFILAFGLGVAAAFFPSVALVTDNLLTLPGIAAVFLAFFAYAAVQHIRRKRDQ